MTTETTRKSPLLFKGVVTSKSGDKTIRVTLKYQTCHPKYGKILKRRTNAHVHDEKNVAKLGDQVEICKCRPFSKTKNWRLVRVMQAG